MTGKQRLDDIRDVHLVLRQARRVQGAARVEGRSCTWTVARGYECDHCGGWHLTSQPGHLAA
ncbi:hypothetical protein [Dietzia sp. SYD-A1]|uniref:hypothetical protein n=1 Tax=Dietzia sp. SYD-A1 TaxID=2780141 RepID=UPI0018910FBF|nr:hypothetical protein [Dietzia sp. SYD-A1]